MAEEERRRPHIRPPDAASGGKSEPTPLRSMAGLADAVKRLDEEMARQARCYEDAHAVQMAVGAIQGVLIEVADLEERRDTLAKEIGNLEAQLIVLRADVAKAKTET